MFDGVHAAGPVAGRTDDAAWLQAMLDFEAALARACADAGLVSISDAEAIAAVARAELYDAAELGELATSIGNPAGPLVRALTDRAGDAGRAVHLGGTSQDVLDTAAMLVAARSLDALLPELAGLAGRLAELAAEHARTVQLGRTLLQHAPPVTFGLVVAGWLAAVDAAAGRLAVLRSGLAVQLGGAVGTLASLGAHGPTVLAALAGHLGLAEPALPWHTDRTRIADLAGGLVLTCGAVDNAARDIVLLAGSDVAELREQGPPGAGGSSTLPHKRNPVAAVSASACARRAPGLASTLYSAMAQEFQRAAGAWQSEWPSLRDLLRATGSAVHWLRTSVDRLVVDAERMRVNLAATGGLAQAEHVTSVLAVSIGRLRAHDAVTASARRAAAGDGELADLLAADPVIAEHLSADRIVDLLDPAGYLGSAEDFVRRALAAHNERTPT